MNSANLQTSKAIKQKRERTPSAVGLLSGCGANYQAESIQSKYSEQKYAMGVPNGTLGLLGSCIALDIRNSEVITTPYTWGGSLSGILLLGNKPKFCDINSLTLTLNPKCVRKAINTRTKAILAVDIYGNPCDMLALRSLADEHGIWLIQDCAQSLGAIYEGRPSGYYADIAVYSFSPGKLPGMNDGGMVCTNNGNIYDRLVWHTQHPLRQMRDVPQYSSNEFALNLRIPSMTAQRLCERFESGLQQIRMRQRRILELETMMSNELGIPPISNMRRISSYHRWTIESNRKKNLVAIERHISKAGYSVRFGQPPITRPIYADQVFKKLSPGPHQRCKVAEEQLKKRILLDIGSSNTQKREQK